MTVLTDTDIKEILVFSENRWNDDDRKLLIKGGSEECITPMGYDLRVGEFGKKLIERKHLVDIGQKQSVFIKPGDTALIATLESIKMPKDGSISALILSKVSQVSRGLSNVSTKIDPGWSEGELLVPVQNLSRETIKLKYKEKFCTVVFIKNVSPPSSPYQSGSSRKKFFKLLAQTKTETRNKDIIRAVISILIIIIFPIIGWRVFGNTTGLAVMLTAGLAIKEVVSGLLSSRWFGQ
ncbi:hypothetical protein POG22_17355 [Geitlerinema sp. CS-897]|nr:hypothetical protein [Geitlerinema sp. CS-897]